jgi:predicted ArsR family transcriptional regulator
MTDDTDADVQRAAVPLDRDRFMRALIRQLAGSLEDVIGPQEAKGYFSLVGSVIGSEIGRSYLEALQRERLDRAEVAAVLVDLKRRIEGDFYIISQDDEKIVLGNRACPFGDQVLGHPSMCMMTSNMMGAIAASNLGYAKVELQETIARGHQGCRVVVYLKPDGEAADADGREYFPVLDIKPEERDRGDRWRPAARACSMRCPIR